MSVSPINQCDNQTTDLIDKMISLQNEYFALNSKNQLFKKTQKLDSAKYISEKIDINQMIEESVFIIPETNILFIDYVIFKLFANDDLYEIIINHIMNLFDYLIKYYGTFTVNINLRTFTVSAAERYIPAIKQFCNRCLNNNTKYTEFMTTFRVLNTPSVMDMVVKIVKPFVEKDVISKIEFLNKTETSEYCKNVNYVIKSDFIQK